MPQNKNPFLIFPNDAIASIWWICCNYLIVRLKKIKKSILTIDSSILGASIVDKSVGIEGYCWEELLNGKRVAAVD